MSGFEPQSFHDGSDHCATTTDQNFTTLKLLHSITLTKPQRYFVTVQLCYKKDTRNEANYFLTVRLFNNSNIISSIKVDFKRQE